MSVERIFWAQADRNWRRCNGEIDCLLVGHNELEFQQYFNILENMASSGGRDHVAFTDMQLNCVRYKGKPYQAMDILTKFYNEGLDPKTTEIFTMAIASGLR